jgi:hypothetical protein
MAGPRALLHLPLIAGACTAAYAGSLVFVTSQQAAWDRDVAAQRAPLELATSTAALARSEATRAIRQAADRLHDAAAGYDAASGESASLDGELEALAVKVAELSGAVAQLPDRISLPTAQVRVVQVAAPVVQAVTGASGQ